MQVLPQFDCALPRADYLCLVLFHVRLNKDTQDSAKKISPWFSSMLQLLCSTPAMQSSCKPGLTRKLNWVYDISVLAKQLEFTSHSWTLKWVFISQSIAIFQRMLRKRKHIRYTNIQFRTRHPRQQLKFWTASAEDGDADCWALNSSLASTNSHSLT